MGTTLVGCQSNAAHFYADVKRGVRKERCPEREVVGKEGCPN